jgi:hypothetical protein
VGDDQVGYSGISGHDRGLFRGNMIVFNNQWC